ncbi:hypothetical protein I4U23_011307 [Adineta vaga]|nr:hypothetical protein I4U23_011307 [Adineta vaga]
MSLIYIAQQITIYGGFCLLITGVLGNTINVYIFSIVRSYRTNPATFYFLIASIFNTAFLMINLSTRIAFGFNIDVTQISTHWCKARNYLLYTLSMIVVTCPCMAMIDQFLVTSRHVKLRRLSNIRWAHRFVLIMIIISNLQGIPAALSYEILPTTGKCEITYSYFGTYECIEAIQNPLTQTQLNGKYYSAHTMHRLMEIAKQKLNSYQWSRGHQWADPNDQRAHGGIVWNKA